MKSRIRHITVLRVLFLSTFLCIYSLLNAQKDNTSIRNLEDSEITDLKELVKYDKTVKKLRLKKIKKEKGDKKREIKEIKSSGVGSIMQMLIYAGIVALIGVVIYLVFSNIKLEKPIPEANDLNLEDVENIESIGAQDGLRSALDAENYREAVRMLFIQLLQILVKEESIKWRPEKTNRDYLREMRSHDKVSHFRNLVMVYEQVWYGEEQIDKQFFDHVRADFEKFYSTGELRVRSGDMES